MHPDFESRPDTTVPPAARIQMAKRGPGDGYAHSLAEISEILFLKGETDRRLRPQEVQDIIDGAVKKLRVRLKRLDHT